MTLGTYYKKVKFGLQCVGIESLDFEATQLFKCLGIDKKTLIAESKREVDKDLTDKMSKIFRRRVVGEPLQYILGEWEFYGLPFKVGEGVLIPRQDTETLVELALEFLRGRDINARTTADLCAGSGCIGITLAKLADANVLCVEPYYTADGYLRRNARLNNVEVSFSMADACSDKIPFSGFDLIVCNPPYLSSEDMRNLQTEVTYEPEEALYGGEDGLDFYRKMIPIYKPKLFIGGMIAFEIGKGQDEAVCELFRQSGFFPQTKCDANGIIRVVYAIRE